MVILMISLICFDSGCDFLASGDVCDLALMLVIQMIPKIPFVIVVILVMFVIWRRFL